MFALDAKLLSAKKSVAVLVFGLYSATSPDPNVRPPSVALVVVESRMFPLSRMWIESSCSFALNRFSSK